MNEEKIRERKINKKSHITPCTSQNKGITLVALIITIIILLILAVVAIRSVSNDGIISHAKNAQTRYEQEQAKEETKLSEYEQYIASLGESTLEEITIENAQSVDMLERKQNTQTHDKYGNKIVVPAGFKILVDSTTDYTKETIDVTKGIVIQDASGNEFVWVPVGTIYTNEEKTASKTITLGRYSSFTANASGEYVPGQPTESNSYKSNVEITSGSYIYTELQPTANGKGPKGNAIAKNINNFYEKAIASHGYYIGRFEAGVSGYDENATNSNTQPSGATNWTKYKTAEGNDPQLVCKSNQQVWNDVTQNKASELCKSMYTNKPYESDLINSYAWDTAIVFIQTFGANGVAGKETDSSTYASINKSTDFRNTGLNPDKYRNIYDMSGNAWEWTNETSSNSRGPCTLRGGHYSTLNGFVFNYASFRNFYSTAYSVSITSFRPLLYV